MDNIELENKIKEIIKEKNYFDMILKAKTFESEYKKTDFYKQTKKPLREVIKESKIFYALQLEDFGSYLQKVLNNLSLEHIEGVLDQIGSTYAQENEDVKRSLEEFQKLIK